MLPHGPSWDSRSDPQRGAGLFVLRNWKSSTWKNQWHYQREREREKQKKTAANTRRKLGLIQKLWPIRSHMTQPPAANGERKRDAEPRCTQACTPPIRHGYTPNFFLIETFYSRSVSTFPTAIFLSIFLSSFSSFLFLVFRHGENVFSFSACDDLNLGCRVFVLRWHPLRNSPTCLRTLLIFFPLFSVFLSSSRSSFFTSSLVPISTFCLFSGFFLLYHGLFWCGFGAFLGSYSVSLVFEAVRLLGRKNNSFDFHLWGFCFSNRWEI